MKMKIINNFCKILKYLIIYNVEKGITFFFFKTKIKNLDAKQIFCYLDVKEVGNLVYMG